MGLEAKWGALKSVKRESQGVAQVVKKMVIFFLALPNGLTTLSYGLPILSLEISPNHFLFRISTVLFSTNSSKT